MRWFSNLRIGNKLFLVFSAEIVFWAAIFSTFFYFLNRIKTLAAAANPEYAARLNGEVWLFISAALVISLAFVLLIVFLTNLVRKTIVEPIEKLSKSAGLISAGVLDGTLSSNRKDEIGQLSRDLDGVLLVLQSLNGDLVKLCDEHHIAGNVYAKIDADKYEGAYKETAEKLNEMLWQYIADGRDVLYCVSEFTRGGFNTQVRAFPGMRSVMNNISYGLRKALVSLSEDIKNVSSAAAEGNFEKRLDESKYGGEWNVAAREINRLLDEVTRSINEATDAMLEVYDGNLSPEIAGGFKGDFALVKTSLSNAVESVSGNMKELSAVLEELADKNTSAAIKGEFPGDYGAVKAAAERLAESMRKILSGMDKAALSVGKNAERITSLVESSSAVFEEKREESDNDLENNVLSPLDEIGNASERLAAITGLIEDISYQTSLLALNVSVEAARAGERGKGFVLVAEEVKYLAERCQETAEETANLISESHGEILERAGKIRSSLSGVRAITEREARLVEILKAVAEVSGELTESAAALKKASESKKN